MPLTALPFSLCTIKQAGGKVVQVFAAEGDLDPTGIASSHFEMEWPPKSGELRTFPEAEEARWMKLTEARQMMLPSQLPILDALEERLVEASVAEQQVKKQARGREPAKREPGGRVSLRSDEDADQHSNSRQYPVRRGQPAGPLRRARAERESSPHRRSSARACSTTASQTKLPLTARAATRPRRRGWRWRGSRSSGELAPATTVVRHAPRSRMSGAASPRCSRGGSRQARRWRPAREKGRGAHDRGAKCKQRCLGTTFQPLRVKGRRRRAEPGVEQGDAADRAE